MGRWDEALEESSSRAYCGALSEPKIQEGRVPLWLATHSVFLPPALPAHKTRDDILEMTVRYLQSLHGPVTGEKRVGPPLQESTPALTAPVAALRRPKGPGQVLGTFQRVPCLGDL